ncbi:mannosyltransferase putative-domain-containing protein [Aspergillus cavernicola]|uniref:Mannosyltransferase putative-domain-containing protein n=1 Tax=Aspergillus cavernicola TaxID=176166 RepID=A0ABR4IKE7_9EURO
MFLLRPLARIRILLLAIVLACFCIWSFLSYLSSSGLLGGISSANANINGATHELALAGHIHFWNQLQPILIASTPKCDPPVRLGNAPTVRVEEADLNNRPEMLDILPEEVEEMKNAHTKFVDAINTYPPRLHYNPNTRGIVSTAGGSYLPVLAISLRMLRRTGSELPVEVFLAHDDEYEPFICDVVLPSLNARCVVLSHILDRAPKIVEIEKYQFKLFAMLFSSFEEILFLDADSFPILRPETLFTNEPFKSRNMVTWPDFWASTVSSSYYEIASQPAPKPGTRPRQSTESGELLISKKTHSKTLLLSTYYNLWGPNYYYPLLTQGAAGEGDKETFLAAAIAIDEPYYQVIEGIVAMGHRTAGGLAGSAMVQFDPTEDYALRNSYPDPTTHDPPPRPFFIHANFPKFDPATIFEPHDVNPAFADDGSYTRAWTIPENVIENFGTDIEKHYWQEILWTACELEDKFRSWRGKNGICKGVKKYWNAVFADPKG